MATIQHNNHLDFHWTPSEFILSLLVGVIAVAGLWVFAGLLLMLFLL